MRKIGRKKHSISILSSSGSMEEISIDSLEKIPRLTNQSILSSRKKKSFLNKYEEDLTIVEQLEKSDMIFSKITK